MPITVANSTKMEAYSTNEEKIFDSYLEREAADLSWVVLPLDEISSQSFKEKWWINDTKQPATCPSSKQRGKS